MVKPPAPRRLPFPRAIALFLAALFFFQNALLAYSGENTFWENRRARTAARQSLRLASLAAVSPAALPPPAPMVPASPRLGALKNAALREVLASPFATVRQVSLPVRPTGQIVVHIQDVHRNLEAQKNIGALVQSLAKSGQAELIALEGAFGPLHLERFRAFPDREAVRIAADYLRRDHRLSGPVHAAVTHPEPMPPLVGVDDRVQYDANVAAYRRSAGLAAEYKVLAHERRAALEEEKKKTFNPALADFDHAAWRFHRGEAALTDFVGRFSTEGAEPALKAFLSTLEMEKRIDFPAVETERVQLVARLVENLSPGAMEELLRQGAAHRAGQVGYAQFYGFLRGLCRDAAVDLAGFPKMDAYIQYVLAADRIDAEALFTALGRAEKATYSRLAKTPAERVLVAESRRQALAAKLLDFALVPEEWREYQSLSAAASFPRPLTDFEGFYREAHARDAAMARNLMSSLGDTASAVLVTGGYHAPGIAQALTARGITVVSVVPKIGRIDTAQGSAYLSVFSQEKTPLEKLYQGERLFLADLVNRGESDLPALVASQTRRPHDLLRLTPRGLRPDDVGVSAEGPTVIVEQSFQSLRRRLRLTVWRDDVGNIEKTKIDSVALASGFPRLVGRRAVLALLSAGLLTPWVSGTPASAAEIYPDRLRAPRAKGQVPAADYESARNFADLFSRHLNAKFSGGAGPDMGAVLAAARAVKTPHIKELMMILDGMGKPGQITHATAVTWVSRLLAVNGLFLFSANLAPGQDRLVVDYFDVARVRVLRRGEKVTHAMDVDEGQLQTFTPNYVAVNNNETRLTVFFRPHFRFEAGVTLWRIGSDGGGVASLRELLESDFRRLLPGRSAEISHLARYFARRAAILEGFNKQGARIPERRIVALPAIMTDGEWKSPLRRRFPSLARSFDELDTLDAGITRVHHEAFAGIVEAMIEDNLLHELIHVFKSRSLGPRASGGEYDAYLAQMALGKLPGAVLEKMAGYLMPQTPFPDRYREAAAAFFQDVAGELGVTMGSPTAQSSIKVLDALAARERVRPGTLAALSTTLYRRFFGAAPPDYRGDAFPSGGTPGAKSFGGFGAWGLLGWRTPAAVTAASAASAALELPYALGLTLAGAAGIAAWMWGVHRSNSPDFSAGRRRFVKGLAAAAALFAAPAWPASAETELFAAGFWRVLGAQDTGPDARGIQTPRGRFTEIKVLFNGRQVGSVKGNGYYRLAAGEWGTSFMTPGYWTEGVYRHNTPITALGFSAGPGGTLRLSGRMEAEHFESDDLSFRFHPPTAAAAEVSIAFSLKARKTFSIDRDRLGRGEGFKVFQFSSMNVGFEWDADKFVYTHPAVGRIEASLAVANQLVLPRPLPLPPGGEVALTNDSPRRKRGTPTTYAAIEGANLGFVAQGWVAASRSVDDDNVGVGIAQNLEGRIGAGEIFGRYAFRAGARAAGLAAPAVQAPAAAVSERTFLEARRRMADMRNFIRAFLDAQGFDVGDEGWLSGLATNYSAPVAPERPFQDLVRELSPDRLTNLEVQGVIRPHRRAPAPRRGLLESGRRELAGSPGGSLLNGGFGAWRFMGWKTVAAITATSVALVLVGAPYGLGLVVVALVGFVGWGAEMTAGDLDKIFGWARPVPAPAVDPDQSPASAGRSLYWAVISQRQRADIGVEPVLHNEILHLFAPRPLLNDLDGQNQAAFLAEFYDRDGRTALEPGPRLADEIRAVLLRTGLGGRGLLPTAIPRGQRTVVVVTEDLLQDDARMKTVIQQALFRPQDMVWVFASEQARLTTARIYGRLPGKPYVVADAVRRTENGDVLDLAALAQFFSLDLWGYPARVVVHEKVDLGTGAVSEEFLRAFKDVIFEIVGELVKQVPVRLHEWDRMDRAARAIASAA